MGDWELISGQKIAFQNKLYGSTDQRGFRRAYKWGGGGKLKSGGLVSGQKTAFQNFVKQDALKRVQSSFLGD